MLSTATTLNMNGTTTLNNHNVNHNVTRLEVNTLYKDIETYLQSIRSNKTRKSYKYNYEQFFSYMKNKKLEELRPEDLKFKMADIFQYRMYLQKKYSNTSVNQKMASLKSLYKFLSGNEYDVNINIFNMDKLPEHNSKSYGVLHWEEVELMIETVKKQRKGLEKSLLIELAGKTSIRLGALLNLKWSDITKKNTNNKEKWTINIIDKSQPHKKDIHAEFYYRLGELKKINGNDKIFSLTQKTANKMIKELVKELNIDESRNITFHSLKKTGIEEVWKMSNGDVRAIQYQGNHKNPNTPLKHYFEEEADRMSSWSLQVGKKLDFNKLEELSKEELLELIKKSSRGVQIELLNMIK